MVGGLLCIDLLVLTAWQWIDPLQRSIQTFPLEFPSSTEIDIRIRPELEHCESTNHAFWLGKHYLGNYNMPKIFLGEYRISSLNLGLLLIGI